MMESNTTKDLAVEFPGLIRVFKDGLVERLWGSPHVPPSSQDLETGVSSKDVTISLEINLLARLFLPRLENPTQKLPILVYFHGGGFCLESSFSSLDHRYMNIVASLAKVLVVSVEYRLAPEHPLPTAYEDSWASLQWVAAHSQPQGVKSETWLAEHGDFERVFIGGDSAGGNIVHNIALRAGCEALPHGVSLLGAFLSHPFFLGPRQNLTEDQEKGLDAAYKIWDFVYPNAPGGSDNHMINVFRTDGPSPSGLGCARILVLVAGKDELRDWGVEYYEKVRESGFGGEVEVFEMEGEGHAFHIFNPDTDNAKLMFQRLTSFLNK